MERITFCIPSKSNLRYLKTCIKSIRENSYNIDNDIIIYVDEDTDGTIEWLDANIERYKLKYIVNPDLNIKLSGIGPAYNACILQATTDVVMIFHADMILGKNADYELYRHLTDTTVVCSTRIEPPLHPAGPEKIISNFGVWPEDFDIDMFNAAVSEYKIQFRGKLTYGCFAPWMVKKNTIMSIGLHDPIFHSYHEDSDIFNRFFLAGCTLIQSWESFVYHLTCRGGMFEDGITTRSRRVLQLQQRSLLEYIRKWKNTIELETNEVSNFIHHPKIYPRYHVTVWDDIGTRLESMEPWADIIYTTKSAREQYITKYQPHTNFDLSKKIIDIQDSTDDPLSTAPDVFIYWNEISEFNNTETELKLLLEHLRSGVLLSPHTAYQYGNMIISVKNLKNINEEFINCTSPEYISKLISNNNLTGYIGGI